MTKETAKCPVCKKEVEIPKELTGWDKVPEELECDLKTLTGYCDKIVEYLNHDKNIDTLSKRMAILTVVVERIVKTTLTNNNERIGMLTSLIIEICGISQLGGLLGLIDLLKGQQDSDINSKMGAYVA
mgnify:CR=1 FL=1